MVSLLLSAMVASHILAALPAWKALRQGVLPPPVTAGAVSFLLYYDVGLAFELLGFQYDVPYFRSVLDLSPESQRYVLSLLIIAPWIMILGARSAGLVSARGEPSADRDGVLSKQVIRRPWLRMSRAGGFYGFALAATALPAWYGLNQLIGGGEIWAMRAQVGAQLGPFIIILSLPMHVLAFYAATEDARTANGRLFTIYVAFAAVCASIICSQRTLVLFPTILATLSFFRRVSIMKAASLAFACVVMAAAILPILRGSYRDKSLREDNLVVEIVHNDFSRASVLGTVVDLSPAVGTYVLPRTMAGYKYASLFFVPRQVAPFKGRSTAMHFTGHIMNQRPEWLNWGFGVGMLEELILNVGTRFCLVGVFVYGWILGLLGRVERAIPAVTMPMRIGPLFLCAYHLPSLLLNFGLMAFVCLQLSWIFVEEESERTDLQTNTPVGAMAS